MISAAVDGVSTKQDYIDLEGGLDLVTPALKTKPGSLIDAGNFVPDIGGGYRRVAGYERFDGRPSPNDAEFHVITVTGLTAIATGATVTGATSGATSVACIDAADGIVVVTKLVGTYTASETLNVSATPVGTFVSIADGAADTLIDEVTRKYAAADIYRADIAAMTGSGMVRGIHVYKGSVYAWRDNVGGTALIMWKATSSGWAAVAGVPALLPGGRVKCINHNFSGGAATQKMYGVDGANKAFEFDGTTYTQITSTAAPDTPSAVAAHVNRLFLANLGSLFVSSPGAPTAGWVGVGTTPAEFGTGDLITNLLPMPGGNSTPALAIFGRNKTSILYGSSNATWQMITVSPDTGAIAHTAQYIGSAISLDDKGVTSLSSTQNFGNFAASTLSAKIKPVLTRITPTVTDSSLLRSQNQYRLWFSDGTGIAFRIEDGVKGACPIYYPEPVRCIFNGEDTDGSEVVFFGSDNGMVYQAEVGPSFDGENIVAWARLAFNSVGGPSIRKTWRRARVDVDVPEYAQIYVGYEHDYGNAEIAASLDSLEAVASATGMSGGGGFWDSYDWDTFNWDAAYIEPPVFKLDGTSTNISLLIRTDSNLSLAFAIESVLLHYTPRRLDRSAR